MVYFPGFRRPVFDGFSGAVVPERNGEEGSGSHRGLFAQSETVRKKQGKGLRQITPRHRMGNESGQRNLDNLCELAYNFNEPVHKNRDCTQFDQVDPVDTQCISHRKDEGL